MMMCSFSNECDDQRDAVSNNSGGLSLDNMTGNDRLVIKTNNSTYRFVMTDPALRQGLLSGGALSDTPRSVILVGSILEGAGGFVSDFPGLKVGARAVFYLASSAGMERLITSVIIKLTLIKGDKKLPPVTDSSAGSAGVSPAGLETRSAQDFTRASMSCN